MTSEAVDVVDDPTVASPALVALVAKREQELRGEKPATPASDAKKAKEAEVAGRGSADVGQAEEVEAEGGKGVETPDKGKSDDTKKALDVEWAKTDALKRRIVALHEAGQLDDDVLGLLKDGARSKEIVRGANKKFEEAAEKVKAANAERDAFKDRAERYDRLMADPKFHKALHATESDDTADDESLMTADERKVARLEREVAEIKAEKAKTANSEKEQKARVKEIEGWAEEHRSSLGDGVTQDEYEAAFAEMLKDMVEEKDDPRDVLTHLKLVRRVNRILERHREEKDVLSLRERVDDSKRDVVRSARASSPAGVRTEVAKTYPSTPQGKRQARIAATLEKYPLRPE